MQCGKEENFKYQKEEINDIQEEMTNIKDKQRKDKCEQSQSFKKLK